MKSIFAIFFMLGFYVQASAQLTTRQAMERLYSPGAADAVLKLLHAKHVHTIIKTTNDGKTVTTVKLDAAGRLGVYQFNTGFATDSMIYDDSGRVKQYWQLSPTTIMSHYTYDYKAGLPIQYSMDSTGNKKRISYFIQKSRKDTGIVINYSQRGTMTTKSYTVGNIEYTEVEDSTIFDGKIDANLYYDVTDTAYARSHHARRLLEQGEIDLQKALLDTIETLLENGKKDDPALQQIMLLGLTVANSKNVTPKQMASIRKEYPVLKTLQGKRAMEFRYVYDDAHDGRVVLYDDGLWHERFEIHYDTNGRVIEVANNGSTGTKLYNYNKDGLPQSISGKGTDTPEAVFTYTFW